MPFPLYTSYIYTGDIGTLEESVKKLTELKNNYTLVNKIVIAYEDDSALRKTLAEVVEKNVSVRCIEFVIQSRSCFPDVDIFREIRAKPNITEIIFDFQQLSYIAADFKDFFHNRVKFLLANPDFAFTIELKNIRLDSLDGDILDVFSDELLNQTPGLRNLIFRSLHSYVKGNDAITKFRSALAERQKGNFTLHLYNINPIRKFYNTLLDQHVATPLTYEKLFIGFSYMFEENDLDDSAYDKPGKLTKLITGSLSEFNKTSNYISYDYITNPIISIKDLKLIVNNINKTSVEELVFNNLTGPSMLSIFDDISEFNTPLSRIRLGINFAYSESENNPACLIDLLEKLNKKFHQGYRSVVLRLSDVRYITDFEHRWREFVKACELRLILYIDNGDAFNLLKMSCDNYHIRIFSYKEYSPLTFHTEAGKYTSITIMNVDKKDKQDKQDNNNNNNQDNNNNYDGNKYDIEVVKILLKISNINANIFAIKQQFIYLNHKRENLNKETIDYQEKLKEIIDYQRYLIEQYILNSANVLFEAKQSKTIYAMKNAKIPYSRENWVKFVKDTHIIVEIPHCLQELGTIFVPLHIPKSQLENVKQMIANEKNSHNNNNNKDNSHLSDTLLECNSIIKKYQELHAKVPNDFLEDVNILRMKYIQLFEPNYKQFEERCERLEELHESKPNEEMEELYFDLLTDHMSMIQEFGGPLNGEIPEKFKVLGDKIAVKLSIYQAKNSAKRANKQSTGPSSGSIFTNWSSFASLMSSIPQNPSSSPNDSDQVGTSIPDFGRSSSN